MASHVEDMLTDGVDDSAGGTPRRRWVGDFALRLQERSFLADKTSDLDREGDLEYQLRSMGRSSFERLESRPGTSGPPRRQGNLQHHVVTSTGSVRSSESGWPSSRRKATGRRAVSARHEAQDSLAEALPKTNPTFDSDVTRSSVTAAQQGGAADGARPAADCQIVGGQAWQVRSNSGARDELLPAHSVSECRLFGVGARVRKVVG